MSPALFERQEQKKVPQRETLIRGEGLQEILRVGWRACREMILTQTSYREWVERCLSSVPLRAVDRPSPLSKERCVEENIRARERALELSRTYQSHIGRGVDHPAFAWQEGDKKIYFQARKQFPKTGKITRLYISVPSKNAPEAFRSLCRASLQTGGYEEAQIVFNLESYHPGSLEQSIANNTIIVYVHGEDPLSVDRMVQAIAQARKEAPAAWTLSKEEETTLREQALHELLLPLDPQVSLVEQSFPTSYHHDTYPALYEDVIPGGDIAYNKVSLAEMVRRMRHSFAKPTRCERGGLRDRFRHLPALVQS